MVPAAAAGKNQRFAVDRTLGRLARWLRILGHDVVYEPQLGGRALSVRARREDRFLLTRDTRLRRERDLPSHLVLRSDHFREQLREVAAALPISRAGVLGRCLECNRELEAEPRERARERVPPFVWQSTERFLACRGCRRLYWPATHRAHMLRELAALGLLAPGADES